MKLVFPTWNRHFLPILTLDWLTTAIQSTRGACHTFHSANLKESTTPCFKRHSASGNSPLISWAWVGWGRLCLKSTTYSALQVEPSPGIQTYQDAPFTLFYTSLHKFNWELVAWHEENMDAVNGIFGLWPLAGELIYSPPTALGAVSAPWSLKGGGVPTDAESLASSRVSREPWKKNFCTNFTVQQTPYEAPSSSVSHSRSWSCAKQTLRASSYSQRCHLQQLVARPREGQQYELRNSDFNAISGEVSQVSSSAWSVCSAQEQPTSSQH